LYDDNVSQEFQGNEMLSKSKELVYQSITNDDSY